MSRLKLHLVLNPDNLEDMNPDTTVRQNDRVFMRIFATNPTDQDLALDHISVEIYANHDADILALAPTDCPHAGDIADTGTQVICSVTGAVAFSGGLRVAGDPANGSELTLVQTLMPDERIGNFGLGTGKAGLIANSLPFIVRANSTIHVMDGRSRGTGMIANQAGTTPVIALGFATLKGVPIPIDPAYARATVEL